MTRGTLRAAGLVLSALLAPLEPARAVTVSTHVSVQRITNGAFSLLCGEDTACNPGPFNGVASPTTTFAAQGTAAAATGDVAVFTQVAVTNPVASSGDGVRATATASYGDEYIVAVPLNLTVTVALTGSTTTSGADPGSSLSVVGLLTAFGDGLPGELICVLGAAGDSCSMTIPLEPGVTRGADLFVRARNQYGPSLVTGPDFVATQNFSNSLRIVGFAASDADGNPLSLDLVQAGSGVALTPTGYVPEPGTGVLAGFGLGLLALRRRRTGASRGR